MCESLFVSAVSGLVFDRLHGDRGMQEVVFHSVGFASRGRAVRGVSVIACRLSRSGQMSVMLKVKSAKCSASILFRDGRLRGAAAGCPEAAFALDVLDGLDLAHPAMLRDTIGRRFAPTKTEELMSMLQTDPCQVIREDMSRLVLREAIAESI